MGCNNMPAMVAERAGTVRGGATVTTMGVRDRRTAATRERIVAVAAELFGARGVEPTTMDEIARGAGLSRTSVFNYFPYKEAILVEIGAGFVTEIGAMAAQHQRRTPRQALYDLADAIAVLATRQPGLIAAVAREMLHPDPGRRRHALLRMRYPTLIESILGELVATDRLRHPRRLASHVRQLVDLTGGAVVRAGGDFPMTQLRAELRANVDLFCDGALREA
jgi:AcrR family transcriptional regulator